MSILHIGQQELLYILCYIFAGGKFFFL